MTPAESELLNKLFGVVRLFVFDAGGDGDGWIVSERYEELANAFERFEAAAEERYWFTTRDQGQDLIVFSNNQETISFLKDEKELPNWAGDIVVRIY